MKHSRRFNIILFILLLLACILPYNIGKAYSVESGTKVYDDALLFSSSEAKSLTKQIKKVEERNNIQLYVVTTDDTRGLSSDDYNDYFFDEGHNQKNIFDHDTIILLINMDIREVYMSCYGQMEHKFPTYDAIHNITDSVAKHLGNGDYYKGCSVGIKKIANKLEGNTFFFRTIFQLVAALLLAMIITLIVVFSHGTRVTTTGNTYLNRDSSRIKARYDNYIRTETKRTKKASSSSGGGSAHHSGSRSGHSHSGGGSRF